MHAALGQFIRGLGNVVFPPICAHCRGLVEADEPGSTGFRHLCARCVDQVDWVRPPHCTTCGSPFYGEMEGTRVCPHCDGLHPVYREGRTAVLHKGPARALVIELKYHHGLHVLADMEEVFRRSAHVCELARGAVLVPVPMHPRKERHRGYNQAVLIAEALARAAGGGARLEALLRRVSDTESQTTFRRTERMANLKNAFALAPGAALNPELRYVLVDDVFTTGSTLNSCARALRRAGSLNLDVVTFGHG
jgi:ComF family protein